MNQSVLPAHHKHIGYHDIKQRADFPVIGTSAAELSAAARSSTSSSVPDRVFSALFRNFDLFLSPHLISLHTGYELIL